MNAEIVEGVINSRNQVAEQIRALGGWFHNIDIAGVQTAPEHFLGDYPRLKWERFQDAITQAKFATEMLGATANPENSPCTMCTTSAPLEFIHGSSIPKSDTISLDSYRCV